MARAPSGVGVGAEFRASGVCVCVCVFLVARCSRLDMSLPKDIRVSDFPAPLAPFFRLPRQALEAPGSHRSAFAPKALATASQHGSL